MGRSFDSLVLREKGFVVELSNRGDKPKKDYNRYRNLEKKKIECAVPGCIKTTFSVYGVCTSHKREHDWMYHKVDWLARIIPPGGIRASYLTNAPGFGDLTESLWLWAKNDKSKIKRLSDFFFDCLENIPGKIPDATSLQNALEERDSEIMTPEMIILLTIELVDKHFPIKDFKNITTENIKIIKDWQGEIPIRLTAALLLLGYICEEANRGDSWYKKREGKEDEINYAGCFMSAGYYLYRRFTKATQKQIRMCLKG